MNAGGSNATIDDFNTNWAFDRAPHDFVGGYNVSGGFNTAAADRLPPGAVGHAAMGQRVEAGDREMVSGRDDHQCHQAA